MKKLLTLLMVFVLAFTNININAETETVPVAKTEEKDLSKKFGKDDEPFNMLDSVVIKFDDKENVEEVKIGAKVTMDFTWSFTDEEVLEINDQDYFEFNLPEGIKFSNGNKFDLILKSEGNDPVKVGDVITTEEGKIKIIFNDEISKHKNVTGVMDFSGSLDESKLDGPGFNTIIFPVKEESEFNFKLKPNNTDNSIIKTGEVDLNLNPDYINWEVEINKTFETLNNVKVVDKLPEGLNINDLEKDVVIYPLKTDLNGKRLPNYKGTPLNFGEDYSILSQMVNGKEVITIEFAKTVDEAYVIEYNTKINEDAKPNKGGEITFNNEVAIFTDNNEEPLDKTVADVIAEYGKLLNKENKEGDYNPETQTFKWTITYNAGQKLQINPLLTDTLDPNLEFKVGTLEIDGVKRPELVTVVGNVMKIQFNETFSDTVVITYETKVKDILITDIENHTFSNRVKSEKKGEEDEEDIAFGTAVPQMIIKSAGDVDYKNKQISWTIKVNVNEYEMKDYTLTDTYTFKGMTLLESSFKIVDKSAIDSDYELKKGTDYEIDNSNPTIGFIVTFIGNYQITESHLVVTFLTDYDFNKLEVDITNNPNKVFKNRVDLAWTDSNGNVYDKHKSEAVKDIKDETKNNGFKVGKYDANNKELTWNIAVNYHGDELLDAILSDEIKEGQTYLKGSLKIVKYTVNSDGTLNLEGANLKISKSWLKKNILPWDNLFDETSDISKFEITEPSSSEKRNLTIKFLENNDTNARYLIEFKTSLDKKVINEKYVNDAVFTNSGKEKKLTDTVEIPNGGKLVNKYGEQSGALIKWEIVINASHSTVNNAIIEDVPSSDQIILFDTLRLYLADVNENGTTKLTPEGEYSGNENPPFVRGVDYLLEINEDVNGLQPFKLKILKPNPINAAYILRYDAQINTTKGDGQQTKEIKNKISLSGENVVTQEDQTKGSTVIRFDTAGAGAWGNKKGFFQIQKQLPGSNQLEGVKFELWTTDKTGKADKKIAEKTTDINGKISFLNLVYSNYILKEVQTLPGYVISDNLFNGITITVNDSTSKVDDYTQIENETNKINLNKKDVKGNLIDGSEFELLKDNQVIDANISVKDGSVTIEGLLDGDYVLREVKAPEGFILNTNIIEFTIGIDELNKPVDLNTLSPFEFINYQGEIELRKYNEKDDLLAGVVFSLFKEIDGVMTKVETPEPLKTNELGILYLNELAPGNYQFIETESVDGNMVNETPILFTIEETSSGKPDMKVVSARNGKATATFVKMDEAKIGIEGVSFTLYKLGLEDTREAIDNNVLSGSNGVVTVKDLTPGNYVFVENEAPDGYLLNTKELAFTISKTNNVDYSEVETYIFEIEEPFVNYQGTVILSKTDGASGDVLPGVKYNLLNSLNEVIKFDLVTDSNGQLTVKELAPGNYSFVETQSVQGNIVNQTPIPFTIQSSNLEKPADIKVTSTNSKGAVVFKKTNILEEGLSDSIFNLYKLVEDKYENVGTVASNVEGYVRVDHLSPGKYYFQEEQATPGYLVNLEKIEFEMPEKALESFVVIELDSFENHLGSVQVKKVDTNNNTLSGVMFDLYDANHEIIERDLVTDENGEILLSELAPGSYYFVETKSADGNIVNETPLHFVIQEESMGAPETVKVNATNRKGSVKFKKQNDIGKALSATQFKLLNSKGEEVAVVMSNKEGIVEVNQLVPGNYTFEEIVSHEGYLLNTRNQTFEIPEKALTETYLIVLDSYTNYQGTVVLNKTDGKSGKALSGVQYDLFNSNDEKIQTELSTDKNGELVVDKLSPGDYYFVETKSVKGNIVNETPILFTIQSSSSDRPAIIKVSSTNSKGSVEFKKTNILEEGLSDSVFSLYKLVDETYENIGTVTSNKEGIVRMDQLTPGKYYFVEEQATPGYLVNQETLAFEMPEKANESLVVIELDSFVNHMGSVKLKKVDTSNNVLSDVVFDLYDENHDVIIKDLKTDKDGLISLSELAPGEYYFVETKSLNGNIVNESPLFFVIAQESMGAPDTVNLTATNGKGSVIFKKTNELKQALSDTQFKLYDAKGQEIADMISNLSGMVEVNQLIPGKYTIKEVKAHTGYIVNTTTQTFEIPEKALTESFVYELDDFINYKASVKVTKTDREGLFLKEATFDLKLNGNVIKNFTTLDSVYDLEDLSPGKYEIVETKAPKGYTIDSAKIVFEIDSELEGKPEMLEITIVNDRVEAEKILPGTGIADSTVYKTSLTLMGLGLALTYFSKKKKRMAEEA